MRHGGKAATTRMGVSPRQQMEQEAPTAAEALVTKTGAEFGATLEVK